MVNYFIYAKDFSASTNGMRFYHSHGLKTLYQFKKDVKMIQKDIAMAGITPTESRIAYLHWGEACYEVSENETRKTYLAREGDHDATDPTGFINWIQNYNSFGESDSVKLLYIITDGLIPDNLVQKCFEMNEKMNYEKVVFHAFSQNLQAINLSVAASFLKGQCMIYRNKELYDNVDMSKEYEYDKINIHNFAAEREHLKSYIKLKFISKLKYEEATAFQEIEKLKKLRNRLFRELTLLDTEKKENIQVNLETKDKTVFLREFVNTNWFKNLNASVFVEKVEIEKSISTLINYIINDVKSYDFDALKFDKIFDKTVIEEEVTNIDFTAEQEIEFPDIILEDDKGIPVILLTDCSLMDKIIFHNSRLHGTRSYRQRSQQTRSMAKNTTRRPKARSHRMQLQTQRRRKVKQASYTKFKSTMECPLYLVNDKDIMESIGHFYTLNVYKQLLVNNMTDPLTRKQFRGGIVLTDSNQFDKYNDYILSLSYFNGKKVKYNVGLFYFVLFKIAEKLEWMDRNVVEQLKKYTLRRISETVCKIGLSCLPMDPKENTSLLTALWYCVEMSSCIFKNDPKNFKQERLRRYYNVAPHMVEILKSFNYDLNLDIIEKRRELICQVMTLKRIRKQKEKVYYLLDKIFKNVDGFLVSEIENPSHLYQLNYLKLNHKKLLPDDVVEEKIYLNDFVHLMYFEGNMEESKAGRGTFEICENTFRPFYTINQHKSFYEEFVENARKIQINNDDEKDKIEIAYKTIDTLEMDRVLSRYKLFIDCVKELEKYPTLCEYVEYVSMKKKFTGKLVTIFPSNVYFELKNVHESYQSVVANVEVEEFVNVCKTYVNRTDRIKAENRLMFSSDIDIVKFISSQESKVNLTKRTNKFYRSGESVCVDTRKTIVE